MDYEPFLKSLIDLHEKIIFVLCCESVQIPSSEDVPKRDSLISFLACEILHLLTGTFDVD